MKMYLGQMVGLCCGGVTGSEVIPLQSYERSEGSNRTASRPDSTIPLLGW